jgi:hypothetical protein
MDIDDQHTEAEGHPADLMVSADPIRDYLVTLGVLPESATNTDVYYLKRSGWPIGNTAASGGGKLIASKRRLSSYASKLSRGSHAA